MIKDKENLMIATVLINDENITYCMETNMCSIFAYLRDNPESKIIFNNEECCIQILNKKGEAIIEFEPENDTWD